MDNNRLKPLSSVNQTEGGSGCGPGCNCGGTKSGKKGKAIICLVVALAAVIVLAHATTENTGGMSRRIYHFGASLLPLLPLSMM